MTRSKWSGLLAANAFAWCVLSLYQTPSAAPTKVEEPFANSVRQRETMIRELQEIKLLLQKQNEILTAEFAKKDRPDEPRSR